MIAKKVNIMEFHAVFFSRFVKMPTAKLTELSNLFSFFYLFVQRKNDLQKKNNSVLIFEISEMDGLKKQRNCLFV